MLIPRNNCPDKTHRYFLSFLNIVSTTHNLQGGCRRSTFTLDVHFANRQFISVGMFANAHHFTYDKSIEHFAEILDTLHLQPDRGEPLSQIFRANSELNVLS